MRTTLKPDLHLFIAGQRLAPCGVPMFSPDNFALLSVGVHCFVLPPLRDHVILTITSIIS